MYPVLFSVGGYSVYSYGVCVILGLATLYAVTLIPARRAGGSWGDILTVAMAAGAGSLVGMRLAHTIVEPYKLNRLLDFYGMFQPGTNGNIVGMMIGGYLGGWAIRRRVGLLSLGNFYAPAFAAASFVWRIGCFLGGCCYGKETNLPWAIYIDGAYRHPTMAYDGLFNLAMFFVVWRLRRHVTRENQLLHIYFIAYAAFRFWLEYLRLYPQVALGLTGVQFLCIAILIWQGVRFWLLRRTEVHPASAMA